MWHPRRDFAETAHAAWRGRLAQAFVPPLCPSTLLPPEIHAFFGREKIHRLGLSLRWGLNQNQNLKQKSFGYLLTVRTDNNQNQNQSGIRFLFFVIIGPYGQQITKTN